jgi:hypothetical protein
MRQKRRAVQRSKSQDYPLLDHIDPHRPLVRLAAMIDWPAIERVAALTVGTPYENCLQRADIQLANAQPLYGRPFIWNDDAAFVVATKGFDHAMFA